MTTTTTKTAAKKTAAPKTETKTAETPDVMSFSSVTDWANGAQEQFETLMSSFTGNFEDLRAQAEDLAETTQARVKTVQDHAAKTNALLVEAAQEEVSSTVQLASDLGKAKTFADALTVQQAYWTKLFEDRMTYLRDITESSVETARETLTPVETPLVDMKAFEKFFAFPLKA